MGNIVCNLFLYLQFHLIDSACFVLILSVINCKFQSFSCFISNDIFIQFEIKLLLPVNGGKHVMRIAIFELKYTNISVISYELCIESIMCMHCYFKIDGHEHVRHIVIILSFSLFESIAIEQET